MGKKSRKDKVVKVKKMKDEPARIKAVNNAKSKIESLGLSPEIEGIKKFYDICNVYIETGEHYSGKIKLEGFKRVLEFILPQTYQTDIGIVLKFDKNV